MFWFSASFDELLEDLDAGEFDHDHLPARAIAVHFAQRSLARADHLATQAVDDLPRPDAVIAIVVLLAGKSD